MSRDADRHHEKCVTSTNDKRSGSWTGFVVYDDRVDGRKVREGIDGDDDRVDKNEEAEIRWRGGGEQMEEMHPSVESSFDRRHKSPIRRQIEMRVRQTTTVQESRNRRSRWTGGRGVGRRSCGYKSRCP